MCTVQYLLAAALITIENVVLFFDLVHIMLDDPRSWVALFCFWDEDGICLELCREHHCTEKCRPYLSGVTAATQMILIPALWWCGQLVAYDKH